MLKILFVADVVGSPGRKALRSLLPGLRRQYDADLVIVNAENSAGGFGLTADAGAELFLVPAANCDAALGADVREDEIHLVRTATMHEAVEALESYAEDADADLPTCQDAA